MCFKINALPQNGSQVSGALAWRSERPTGLPIPEIGALSCQDCLVAGQRMPPACERLPEPPHKPRCRRHTPKSTLPHFEIFETNGINGTVFPPPLRQAACSPPSVGIKQNTTALRQRIVDPSNRGMCAAHPLRLPARSFELSIKSLLDVQHDKVSCARHSHHL